MKRFSALLLAVLLVLALAACSGSKQDKATEPAQETAAATQAASAAPAEPTVPKSTSDTEYNVGEFTVYVPKDWEAIPVPDRSDESVNAANDIMLAKGAVYDENAGKWNTEESQSFYITKLGAEDFAKVSGDREQYAKDYAVKDMEDTQIGSLTWHGFSVSPIGADVYVLWAESGDGGYRTSLSTAYGLSLEDEDVKAILGSLK